MPLIHAFRNDTCQRAKVPYEPALENGQAMKAIDLGHSGGG